MLSTTQSDTQQPPTTGPWSGARTRRTTPTPCATRAHRRPTTTATPAATWPTRASSRSLSGRWNDISWPTGQQRLNALLAAYCKHRPRRRGQRPVADRLPVPPAHGPPSGPAASSTPPSRPRRGGRGGDDQLPPGIFGGFGHPGLEESGTFGLQDHQAALGCADPPAELACLRRVPVKSLFAHAAGFQPYAFGGRVLAGHPVTAELPHPAGRGLRGARQPSADPLSAVAYGSPNLAWAAVLTGRMWARETFHAAEVPNGAEWRVIAGRRSPPPGPAVAGSVRAARWRRGRAPSRRR
jgi:hypothetical protein